MTPPKTDTAGSAHPTKRAAPVTSRVIPAVPLLYSRARVAPQPKSTLNEVTNNSEATVPQDANNRKTGLESEQKDRLHNEDDHSTLELATGTSPELDVDTVLKTNGDLETAREPSTGDPQNVQEAVKAPLQRSRNNSLANGRIPTELPPPFYPSDAPRVPTPTAATSTVQQHPSMSNHNNVTLYQPRPNNNHIVFGGYPESNNTSPAPPSGGMMPFQIPTHPPPGFVPQGYPPPPFFPAHGHHLSDPHVGTAYHPIGTTPNGFGYGRDHPQSISSRTRPPWIPSESFNPYSGRYQDTYIPRAPYFAPNGAAQDSRSPSQASTKTQEHDANRSDNQNRRNHGGQMNGHLASPVNGFSESASLLRLRDWLANQFGNPEFADYILEISHNPEYPPFMMPVHGVIIGRSPTLHDLILSQTLQSASPRKPLVINLTVPSRFYNSHSYMDAIKSLYGGPLLSQTDFDPLPSLQLEPPHDAAIAAAQSRMEHVLAYLLAGHHIGELPVIIDGLTLATTMLRWDTVEKALEFVLDPVLTDTQSSSASIGEQTSPDSDNALRSPRNSEIERSLYGLTQAIVDFLARNFPLDFNLDENASQLASFPRLPTVGDRRASKHQARLSQIRFGELPQDTTPTFSYVRTLLSSIVMSLPLPLLKRILESRDLENRLGRDRALEVASAIIQEREVRRKKVFKSQDEDSRLPLWQNVRWEERIDAPTQNFPGFQISRLLQPFPDASTNGAS